MIYPEICPFCGKISKDGICENCKSTLPYISQPYCYRCGKMLQNEEQEYCRDCRSHKIYFEQGKSLFLHEEKVASAIYRFKFKNQRIFAKTFAKEMAEKYGAQLEKWEIDEMIPIPLNKKRFRKRGFNQAEILGRFLSEYTGIPMTTNALFRIRYTEHQKTLNHSERMWNLRNAFVVSRNWRVPETVLLLDDIYTTGSTINKAAKMLKKAGVQKVYFLTISIGQGL